MYEILLNDKTLYFPASEDYVIYGTNLDLEVGLAGEFEFNVPSSNPLYSQVKQGAIITILRDNKEYWRGEVKETSVDINKVMNVYCLEDLAWLADEYMTPTKLTTETYAQRFAAAITAYNANRPSERQFTIGYITNVTSSNLCNWTTEYDWSILDSLRECICKDDGYIRVRRVTSGGVLTRYVDIVKLSDYGVVASQPITFGVNLLDYVEEMDADNLTNVLTPYGAETDTEIYEDYNARLAGTPIQNDTSIGAYGRHAKTVIFDTDDLTTLNALAAAYLTRYSQPQLTLKISAVDLAEISADTHFEIGDTIRIVAEPFAIDQDLYLTRQNIDLQDISKNSVTLSGTVRRSNTLTNQTIDAASLLKDFPSESSILAAAKRNALNLLLDETQGGYVVYEYDANNEYLVALNICNAKTIAASTKRWRWSQNGFGYMYRANTSAAWTGPSVAMTMDGSIVANFITTGSLVAQNNKYTLNMETGKVVMKDGEFTGKIEADSGEIASMTIDSSGIGADGNNLNTTRINSNGTFAFTHRIGSSWTKFSYKANENIIGLDSAGSTQGDGGLDVSGNAPGLSGSWLRWGWSDGWRSDGYTVVWTNGSDKRLKKNIKALPTDKVRDFFKKINPIKFNYNDKSQADTKVKHYGVIAQDLEAVLSDLGEENPYIVEDKEMLRKDKEGKTYTENYKTVHYQELHAWELAGIKDLYSEIEMLKAEINKLKGENNG